jgi:NitT/TauT family transport system permease protein
MKKDAGLRTLSAYRFWSLLPPLETSRLPDLLMFAAAIALFYGVLMVGRTWLGPFTPSVEISQSPLALPAYAGLSLLRITIAYILSFGFTLVYGYIAAYNPNAERFMIPLLDVLQSIPVLSFLPGVMLAMVALFPSRQLGVELGAILLIFTGQVWNMAFSFYASLKSIPREMREAATIYGFSWWQRFTEMELPFAAIGLVWNSMMSVAGGWFALMACEMFVLGSRDFRLPGLGSYLQTAASAGDTRSILLGVFTMIAVIVLLDQFVWRPVIAWAEKFKVEQVESAEVPHSWVLNLLQHSQALAQLEKKAIFPLRESLMSFFSRRHRAEPNDQEGLRWKTWVLGILGVAALGLTGYAVVRVAILLTGLNHSELAELGRGLGATFLRVIAALLIGAAWTIPVGVKIGFSPRLARVAQPLAQIAASVPANAFFPCHFAYPDSSGSGTGHRLHPAASARHPVVHSVQRDCRGDGDSHRPEGSVLGMPHQRMAALAKAHSSWDFSLSFDGHGHRIRRSVECQHRRRIFSFQGPDIFYRWSGLDDQPCHRHRKFRPADCSHYRDGCYGRDCQPSGVAPALQARRNPLPSGKLEKKPESFDPGCSWQVARKNRLKRASSPVLCP